MAEDNGWSKLWNRFSNNHRVDAGASQPFLKEYFAAERHKATCYISQRRNPMRIRRMVRFAMRIHNHSDRDARNGIALDAWTDEMDALGMVANVRLPEIRWLRGLLTSEMLCRVEMELPDGGGRVEADAATAWAEAFHLGDPCRIGLAFVRLSPPDMRRLGQFVRECQTKALRKKMA